MRRSAKTLLMVLLAIMSVLLLLARPRAVYAEQQNALTDEQYAAFGMHLQDPAVFSDTSDPLADYEPTVLSELYLGTMNAAGQSHYEGSFKVLNDTGELSASALSVKADTRSLIGGETPLDAYNNGFQTQNTCAVDVDGDGVDEIAEIVLYTQDKGSKTDKIDIAVLSYYSLEGNAWRKTTLQSWYLTDPGTSYVQDIDANTSKGYVAIAAGNYDASEDGREEIACYVPSRLSGGAFVCVYDPAANSVRQRIDLSSIDARFDVEASSWTLGGTYMPVVSLATTAISGQDDLVVNVSNPLKSGPDQRAALVVYRMTDGQAAKMYVDTSLTSQANHRMRFCSATDADLLGNGSSALVVGGYENYDFLDNADAGKLSSKNNMVQLLAWDAATGSYQRVWDDPLDSDIAYGSKLATGTAMMEPAALAAGRLRMASASDRVFLEGSILRFKTEQSTTATTFDMLRAGTFLVEDRISLKGDNSAFISQAAIAHFSTASAVCEQLVVLQGDENTFNGMNDKIYYDICWTWEENGQLTSVVTNNDLVESDQDDNGTYASICALNADEDTVAVQYQGCDMGWSEPELYCVLQSPPYWRELLYDSTGSVSFEITSGEMDGRDWDLNIGVGLFARASVLGGVGFLGNDGKIGAAFEIGAMGNFVHEHSFSSTSETAWRVTVSPGQDHVVVFAIPIVNYRYRMYVPAYEMTEQRLEYYNQNKQDTDPVYQVGDTVPGSWQDMSFTSEGSPCVSHIPLSTYNELVTSMGDATHLSPITAEMLPRKVAGDPSTYPRDTVDLKERDNVKSLEISSTAAQVSAGDGETELSFTTGYENEDGDGFHVDAEGSIALAGEYDCSLIFAASGSFEVGIKVGIGGGSIWTGAKSHGWGFSTVFADLPEGTSSGYNYSSNMAVYTLDLPDTSDDPYCIAYTAQTVGDDALPPVLPSQLRVFGTTEDKVLLRWEKGATSRVAQSWEVFVRDNNGIAQSLGIVNAPAFLATSLDPATTYEFSLRAFTGKDGTGIASSRSAWLSTTTKEDADAAPHFSTHPANVLVEVGATDPQALVASAVCGLGMQEKGATISYQWQRFSESSLSVTGSWEDVDGAEKWTDEAGHEGTMLALPTLAAEGASYKGSDGATYGRTTYYRVVATQRVGANVHSVISRTAAMIAVNRSVEESADSPMALAEPALLAAADETVPTTPTLSLSLADNQVEAYMVDDVCFYHSAEVTDLTLVASLDAGDVTDATGTRLLLMRRDDMGDHAVGQSVVSGDGSASFVVPTASLDRGCELYAVFEGTETGGSWTLLPTQSNFIKMFGVAQRSVVYEAGNGTNTAHNPAMLTSLSDTANLSPSLRRGYTFDGWTDKRGVGMTRLGAEQAESSENLALALEASYTANLYPVFYELDGGINSDQNPSSYTVDDAVRLQPASKAGYDFKGWYLDAAHTKPTNTVPLNSIVPVTFYAAWDVAKPDEEAAPENATPHDGGESVLPNTAGNVANSSSATSGQRSTISNASRQTLASTGEGPWMQACAALIVCALAFIFAAVRLGQRGW